MAAIGWPDENDRGHGPLLQWAAMSIELPAWLGDDPATPFPPVSRALREPDGLLAAGGDLSPPRLLAAYAHGLFPWSSEGQPLLWWSPDQHGRAAVRERVLQAGL